MAVATMSISTAVPDISSSHSTSAGQKWLDAALGFTFVVAFPTIFWLGMAEFAVLALDLSYGNVGRVIGGVLLASFLTVIWSIMRGSGGKAD